MLSFDKVNVTIAGVHVLRQLSFTIEPGATCALIGHNGAGKTTTVRTIMGFTDMTGGLRFLGQDLARSRRIAAPASASAMRRRIAGCFPPSRWRRMCCCRPGWASSRRRKPPAG